MSTDEKDFSSEVKPTIRRTKPTPVASANGHETTRSMSDAPRSADDAASGRKRRTRISTSITPTPRFSDRGPRHFSDSYPQLHEQRTHHRDSSAELREAEARRMEYERQYQAMRAERNVASHYNSDRPRGKYQPRLTADGSPLPGKKKKKKKVLKPIEPVKYAPEEDPTMEIRLNKYISNAGECSRRQADEYISQGRVRVNGEVVTELGKRVTPMDEVEFDGKLLKTQHKIYVLLNKPKNFITTVDDEKDKSPNKNERRPTVMDLVRRAYGKDERIYPVGRLDRYTTGVLLLTNDGDLAAKLTHPSYKKKKIYHVWLDKEVTPEDMQQIADGIELKVTDGLIPEEGKEEKTIQIHADAISYVTEEDFSQVGIEIHSGQNRIVRRIFEHLGYRVKKLDRVYFAGLTKKNLGRGKWRYLNEDEVNALRMGAFE